MTGRPVPGAALVARLADLPPLEQRLVRYLRLWSSGCLGQAEVWQDLVARHGPSVAGCAASQFDALVRMIVAYARRPLHCHAPSCPCAGGDECALVRIVGLATEGAREDAVLMAALLVRPDMALGLARDAEALGLTLSRGAARPVTCH